MTACFVALGLDPVPGSPEALDDIAREVGRTAAELTASALALRRLGASSALWQGEAAQAFRARVQSLPRRLDDAAEALRSAQRGLSSLTGELRLLRHRALRLEAAAAAAHRRLPDPDAERDLRELRHRARALRVEALRAAREAEHVVRAAADRAPGEPWLLQRFVGEVVDAGQRFESGLGDIVARNAEMLAQLSTVLGYVSFAGSVPIPVVQQIGLVAAGLSVATSAAVAHYTDGSWASAAFGAAALATTPVGKALGTAAAAARAADGLAPVPAGLRSMFGPPIAVSPTEQALRRTHVTVDLVGVGLNATSVAPRSRPVPPCPGRAGSARRLLLPPALRTPAQAGAR
jgi:uncharacterized protein YukE